MENASIVDSIKSRVERLNPLQLDEVERLLSQLEFNNGREPYVSPAISWPHAPQHRIGDKGAFLVTGATINKCHYFKANSSLDLLQSALLRLAQEYKWRLEAWACFSNHYHFVANDDEAKCNLDTFVSQLHSQTAAGLNAIENTAGRIVWYNYFDTHLSYPKSYLARLNYVHQNPVRHRLVPVANQYRWCSAAWFERTATPAQVKTIYSFKTDRVKVIDDFEV